MSPYVGYATFALAVVLYGAATTLFYLEVVRGVSGGEDRPIAPRLLGGGAAAHAAYVVVASFVRHECPVHSIHFFMSMAALVATGVYLVARARFRLHALGLVVAPLGLVTTLGTFFLGASVHYKELPASFIGLHVFVLLVGEALFLLACAAAVMYLVQERRLKDKKALLKGGLPPLESLDRAVHRFLVAGFPLLTMGVATGTVQAKMLEGGSADEVVRAVLGWVTWFLIAGVLLLRVLAGWRGRRAAYGTLAGFTCAFLLLMFYLVRPMLRGA
ncbi:MAG TPA: cytochrome c biogenesis protein CcsA [Polyangiaceae bacterium]|jgi:ABC-type uncharacterized transport system permease subunit|nr:cytochrome c biogenesis protein CcsA [Polyangiaceae bacterium]